MIELVILIALLNLALSAWIIKKFTPNKKKTSSNAVLLDTSALIDGRIIEVVKSGFVPEQLLIPRFVIAELQLLADKADHLKRERARYGLEVIQDLQDSRYGVVSIISDDIESETGVDEKLVKLSLKLGTLLFTTDYNLLKVAEIEGVRVLNINELAQNLRATHIPGEHADIKIVGKGQEKTQGVGYLPDGTLVVVENAGSAQNKTIEVEFTRNLQTTAGRMMFAKNAAVKSSAKKTPKPQNVQKPQVSHSQKKPHEQSKPQIKKNSAFKKPSNFRKHSPRKTQKEIVEDKLIETINNS